MKYIIKTQIKDVPDKELFYKGTANETGVSKAFNTIVTLDKAEAKKFSDTQVKKIESLLNKDRKELTEKGYSEFKIEAVDMNEFEAASKFAIQRMNCEKIFFALGAMERCRCPLYMVGDGYIEDIRQSMNEWGAEHNLPEDWYLDYGDEEEVFYLGFDILDTEQNLPTENE